MIKALPLLIAVGTIFISLYVRGWQYALALLVYYVIVILLVFKYAEKAKSCFITGLSWLLLILPPVIFIIYWFTSASLNLNIK